MPDTDLPDAVPEAVTALGSFLAFDGDRLVVTDADHPSLTKIDKKRLSPSTSNSLARGCHARWAVEQMLPRHEDPFGAAELGSAGHAVLEELLKRPVGQRGREDAAGLLAQIEDLHPELAVPDGPMDLARWRGEVASKIATTWDIVDLQNLRVLSLERHLDHVDIDGVPLRGYIDVEALDPNTGVRTLDWKTGKAPRKHGRRTFVSDNDEQQRVYALGLAAHDGTVPATADLVYTAAGLVSPVDLSPQALDATRSTFVTSWETLQKLNRTGEFTTTPSGLCPWCPLALVCPAANADKPVNAKTDTARLGPHMGIRTARRTHVSSDADHAGRNTNMTAYCEPKAWEETYPHPHQNPMGSDLNLNSYAAISAYGMVELALEHLSEQNDVKPSREAIRGLAATLNSVVLTAQQQLINNTSMQAGFNTRLRGALRTVLKIQPMPFGGDDDDWKAWHDRAVSRLAVITQMALELWADPHQQAPWVHLTGASGVQQQRSA